MEAKFPTNRELGRPGYLPGYFLRRLGWTKIAGAAIEGEFTFGIEEEYFLAHADTMEVVRETPAGLLHSIDRCTNGHGVSEFLQGQVEVSTSPHVSMASARSELRGLRSAMSAAAAEHGMTILASGTHPTACWEDITLTPKQRYYEVMDELQIVGRRDMVCGMHVHVELPEPELRVDVMSRMIPYIPLLLALSTSSPFWRSHCTGLKGYRLAAYDELPRTGIPELFMTSENYDAYITALVRGGVIPDSSYVWWMIRPSHNFPTLELRAPDCCTRLDDAIAIAALYRSLARHLYLHPFHNADLNTVDRCLAVENKWRAQRYGVQGTFVTKGKGAVKLSDMLDDLIEMIAHDADALGCTTEVNRCHVIVTAGNSADAQLEVFHAHEYEGTGCALKAVSNWVAGTTLQG